MAPLSIDSDLNQSIQTLRRGYDETVTVNGTITKWGAMRLANQLKANKKVLKLCLNSCDIEDEQITIVASALSGSPSMKSLFLGINNISWKGMAALSQALPFATSLTTLTLFSNNLGDEGVIELARILRHTCIEHLDLGKNQVGFAGAEALGAALEGSCIKDLLLTKNQIDDEACIALCRGIKVSTRIEWIDLQFNNQLTNRAIDDENGILNAVLCHRSIRVVDVMNTKVEGDKRNQLIHHIAKLHKGRSKFLTVMLSAQYVPRIGKNSPLRLLSSDLIRAISDALQFDD